MGAKMTQDNRQMPTKQPVAPQKHDSLGQVSKTPAETKDIVEVVDRNVGRALEVLESRQNLSHDQAIRRLGLDRLVLWVFAISLLAALGVMFYLIIIDRLTAVNNVLYPLISLVIGFMSGYFAGGSGRSGRRG
jgi:hypothetical protein